MPLTLSSYILYSNAFECRKWKDQLDMNGGMLSFVPGEGGETKEFETILCLFVTGEGKVRKVGDEGAREQQNRQKMTETSHATQRQPGTPKDDVRAGRLGIVLALSLAGVETSRNV